MKELCTLIGCSGLDSECPGNPNCTILKKIIKAKRMNLKAIWEKESSECNNTRIQPFESWLSEKLEEAVELLEDVNFCINEGETIKCFRELCQFLDQFKGE